MFSGRIYTIAACLVVSVLCPPLAYSAETNATSKTLIIKSPEDYADTPWAKLNIPAGTKLITHTSESGKQTSTIEFAAGVSISKLENGGIVGVDNSKSGAVLCSFVIYDTVRRTIKKCHPDEKELAQSLDLAIEKIEGFIVVNSLTPTTKSQLETQLSERDSKNPAQCDGDAEKMAQRFMAQKTRFPDLQISVDELLSVPRPPVMNPCL